MKDTTEIGQQTDQQTDQQIDQRIDLLDYLRGFALLGIILVNILPLLNVRDPAPNLLDASYFRFLYLFVEGRFYTIFTFLFGVGFYIFITRAQMKGKNGYILFLRRAAALLVFGLVHVQFHPGEALTIYAICGALLLPFYKAPKPFNLIVGIVMLVVFSFFSYKLMMVLPIMLLGISAGQYRIFQTYSEHLREVGIFTGIMFVLSGVGLSYQYQYAPTAFQPATEAEANDFQRFFQVGITIGPLVSAFYVGLVMILLKIPFISKLLSPIKKYGQMALTNYLAQTALVLFIGSSLNLVNRLTCIQSLFVCLSIWLIQLIFSIIWLRFFTYGPLEWIWRMITYLRVVPIKKLTDRK